MIEYSSTIPKAEIPAQLHADLHRMNPWWTGADLPQYPQMRRHLVSQMRRRMNSDIAPIVAVRGPRQVGKTTAQFQIIADLLEEGIPPTSILRMQFDETDLLEKIEQPILKICDWFEQNITGERFNSMANDGRRAYLFFDEVQNLDRWHTQLKTLVDSTSVKVVITGSSALRIEMGRDSLAGRISTVEASPLSLTEIGTLRQMDTLPPYLPDNGLGYLLRKEFWRELYVHGQENAAFRQESFRHFSERGGYPIVHLRKDEEWPLLADQLNETVIRRVIQHDLRHGRRGRARDPRLLEEVFHLACRYAGQTPAVATLAGEANVLLGGNIGVQRVNHYLRFLADTLLIRLIPPLEIRLRGNRGSPKLCLADHGLRASWLQEQVPLTSEELARQPELTTLAGRLAESVFGSVVSTIQGLNVAHFPERGTDREVDFVLSIGAQRVPVEIKYQRRIDPLRDTLGLRSFLEKSVNNASFGLLITQDGAGEVDDPRIITIPLSTFMLLR